MALLKIEDTPVTREKMTEKSKSSKSVDKRTFVIAQEIKLAKVLAGNNKTLRERALRRLKRWFEFRSKTTPFNEDDFMRVWKGLFYAMWMSDKPLVQEECAEMISSLVHLNSIDYSLLFFKCGLRTLGNEWFGIDQLRLDKFLMFVRRLLRQGFVILRKNDWNLKTIKEFNNVLSLTILNIENPPPAGLIMHFTEVYLEELAKVSEGNLKPNLLTEFISPFIKQLSLLDDNCQIRCIVKNIFRYLIQQSELGMEYEEKFKAWKSQGFPGGSIDTMQKLELPPDNGDDEEESNPNHFNGKILDPRAGHVDVILPQLKFIPKQIITILKQNRFGSGTNTKSRNAISKAIDEFTQLVQGRYPFGIKKIEMIKKDGYSTKTKNAVNRLVKFEKKLLNKNKKKRKGDVKDIPVKKIDELDEFIKKSEIKINRSIIQEGKKKKIIINENGDVKIKKRASRKLPDTKISIKTKRKKKLNSNLPIDMDYKCVFKRNSGTWFVYDDDSSSITSSILDTSAPISQLNGSIQIEEVNHSSDFNIENTSTPTKVPAGDLFKQDEWENPPKEGEIEIFLQSRKCKKRIAKLNESLTDSSKAKRRSLDSQIVKNPFATPANSKKVKIALNLNKAQDIKEHVAHIKSSPGIPFDANKKPSKPLLKRHTMSPVDPFYRRKFQL